MADAIVGMVLGNLSSLISTEFSLIYGVREDMSRLADTLSTVRDVLADAERRQITEKPIANWLTKLKHAAYDADDVLEEWLTEAQVSSSTSSCLSSMNIVFRCKIAKKTKTMLRKFEEIAKQRTQFILNSGPFPEMHSQFDVNRETTSVILEPHLYGRDGDKENITHMLLNNEDGRENVTIFPIVGMGGLGKTTLAQLVYNDERVVSFFYPKIWVCVSEPFDIKRILKAMIESFDKKHCDLETLQAIQSKVEGILKDKRYLLVLDDVWNEEQDKWNQLIGFLKGGAQGSSIILTTRSLEVASVSSTVQPYNLKGLSENDCWLLIKNYAFGDSNEEEHHLNLVPIGKAIAKRCKGVPLVAKTLGGLLGLKTEEGHWKHVKDDEIWNLKEGQGNSIMLALRLSYDHLPSCLKKCFAICSIYPKDYRMERWKLINLWVANGYIQSQESKDLEEIANDVFSELLQRSFFQMAQEKGFGNIELYTMHDLLHDLAISVSLDECLSLVNVGESTKHVPKTIRHLRLVSNSSQPSTLPNRLLTPQSSLRTLVLSNSIKFDSFRFPCTLRVLDLSHTWIWTFPPSICQLKLLRFLDLSSIGTSSLPKSICKLRNLQMLDLSGNPALKTLPSSMVKLEHLRYLDASFTGITSIPDSFNRLENLRYLDLSSCSSLKTLPETVFDLTKLESLILRNCDRLKELPKPMGKLTNMKHLYIDGCRQLTKMPTGIGQLTCLQTLSGASLFINGDRDLPGRVCIGINELQRLNQLRRRLELVGLENVRNAEEAKTANLGSKKYVTQLILCWQWNHRQVDNDKSISKEVLEGLFLRPHPPPNLQELMISGYDAEEFPPQIFQGEGGGVPPIRYLWIGKCRKLKSLPVGIGNLTELTTLEISSCESLKSLPVGIGNITELMSLEIKDCESLETLPAEIGNLTKLMSLEIKHCYTLESLPAEIGNLTKLMSLEIWGCTKLKSLPVGIGNLTELMSMEIFCEMLESLPAETGNLTKLTSLKIYCCRKLKSLPVGIGNLTELTTLEISSCESLKSLPVGIGNITELMSLEIKDCGSLETLPAEIGNLTKLMSFKIEHCDTLESLPTEIGNLIKLRSLTIDSCQELKSLSVGLGNVIKLTSLTNLSIWRCTNLTSLSEGMRYLRFLRELYIQDCPNLELGTDDDFQHLVLLRFLELCGLPQLRALPEWIQHLPKLQNLLIGYCENLRTLPEWLKRVTTLQSLHIYSCHPDLKQRCKKDEGEDWHKISHIPKVIVAE